MAANQEFKVHCPTCGAKYKFAAAVAGRKARCTQCQTVFRVASITPTPKPAASSEQTSAAHVVHASHAGIPTEDDILRWLAEADDEAGRERRSELDDTDMDLMAAPSTTPAVLQTSQVGSPSPRLRLRKPQGDVLDESAAVSQAV
jgi:hypothetical protein